MTMRSRYSSATTFMASGSKSLEASPKRARTHLNMSSRALSWASCSSTSVAIDLGAKRGITTLASSSVAMIMHEVTNTSAPRPGIVAGIVRMAAMVIAPLAPPNVRSPAVLASPRCSPPSPQPLREAFATARHHANLNATTITRTSATAEKPTAVSMSGEVIASTPLGSCKPNITNTMPFRANDATFQTPFETIFDFDTSAPVPLPLRSNTRPQATADKTPDTPRPCPMMKDRKGIAISNRTWNVTDTMPLFLATVVAQLPSAPITIPHKRPPMNSARNAPTAAVGSNTPETAAANANWNATTPIASLKMASAAKTPSTRFGNFVDWASATTAAASVGPKAAPTAKHSAIGISGNTR